MVFTHVKRWPGHRTYWDRELAIHCPKQYHYMSPLWMHVLLECKPLLMLIILHWFFRCCLDPIEVWIRVLLPQHRPIVHLYKRITGKCKERQYDTRYQRFTLRQSHVHYDMRTFSFSEKIIPLWNSLSDYVVSSPTINTFKALLDKFWEPRCTIQLESWHVILLS